MHTHFTYRHMFRHIHFLTVIPASCIFSLAVSDLCVFVFSGCAGQKEGLPPLCESLHQFKDHSAQSKHPPPPTHMHTHTQASHSFPDGRSMDDGGGAVGFQSRSNQKLMCSLSDNAEFILLTSGGKGTHILYLHTISTSNSKGKVLSVQ